MPNCWRQYRLLTPSLPRARPTFGWWFDEPLDVGKSSVEVRDPAGAVIAEGNVLDDDPDTMMAVLPVLAPGTFEVRWTAGSADGHLVRGTYTFTVEAAPQVRRPWLRRRRRPRRPQRRPRPLRHHPEASATLSPTPDPSLAGGTGSVVLIAIVAALVLVGAFGLFFLRRRQV
jgi:hypothetical protein